MGNERALTLAKAWAQQGNYLPAVQGAVGWADGANRFLAAIDAAQVCERATGADERAFHMLFSTGVDVYRLPEGAGVFLLDESNKTVLFSMARQ